MKRLLLVLLLLAAALAGGAYWLTNMRQRTPGEERFTFAPVEYGNLPESISATGVLEPKEVAAVGSETSGRVVEIYPNADFGKTVTEGEPLVRLDDRAPRLKLEQARVAVQSAQADVGRAQAQRDAADVQLRRQQELHKQGLNQQTDVDHAELERKASTAALNAAQAKVEEARAAQNLAQLGVDWTMVRVPTRGDGSGPKRKYVVLDRKVVLGQLIAPPASAQLFTLAGDLEHVQLRAQVAEGDISKVRSGMRTDFTMSAYTEEDIHFRGQVRETRLEPTTAHGAVFYEAIIDAQNQRDPQTNDWRLRPGMTASVDLIRREHAHAWKMPTAALTFRPADRQIAEAAREKLAQWQERSDAAEWKPAWILNGTKPWPIFVRTGGTNAAGETGIQDPQFTEVLEWDPEVAGTLDPKDAATFPRVIIAGPPTASDTPFHIPIKL